MLSYVCEQLISGENWCDAGSRVSWYEFSVDRGLYRFIFVLWLMSKCKLRFAALGGEMIQTLTYKYRYFVEICIVSDGAREGWQGLGGGFINDMSWNGTCVSKKSLAGK